MFLRLSNYKQRNVFRLKTRVESGIMQLKQFSLAIPVVYYISSPHPQTHLRFLSYSAQQKLSKNKQMYLDELVQLYEFHHEFWLKHLKYLETVSVPKGSMIDIDHYKVVSATHLHPYYKEFISKLVYLSWLRIKAVF